MKMTKAQYMEYLNELGECLTDDYFWMQGKYRHGKYGAMLRKYDPISFEVGLNDWRRDEKH